MNNHNHFYEMSIICIDSDCELIYKREHNEGCFTEKKTGEFHGDQSLCVRMFTNASKLHNQQST